MRHLTLTRTETSQEGTFGTLSINGEEFCVTGEPPWRDNRESISCIPSGDYTVGFHRSPKFGEVCLLHDTTPRTWILIHQGNWCGDAQAGYISDTYGCVLVGRKVGEANGQRCVIPSAPAFRDLMKRLWSQEGDKGDPWDLEIKWDGELEKPVRL